MAGGSLVYKLPRSQTFHFKDFLNTYFGMDGDTYTFKTFFFFSSSLLGVVTEAYNSGKS